MKKIALLEYDPAVETMRVAGRKHYLEKRLKQIVRYAYENAPATRQRFDRYGIKPDDIRSISDLEKLPILRKDELISLHKPILRLEGL